MHKYLFAGLLAFSFFFYFSCFSVFGQTTEIDEMYIDTTYHVVNEPFFFDSSGVSIIPPAYYLPFIQKGKTGFIHKGAGSTLQVEILDGMIYTLIAGSLTAEELLKQNAVLKEHYTLLTNNGKAADFFVVGFSIKALDKDVEYERMMLLTGDHKKTIWVSANYPIIAKSVIFNVLKESLLSVDFE